MIEVGVSGCDNLRAAELVRVLINHPDVELKWVTCSGEACTRLDSIVPGIIGECDLMVNPDGQLDDVDIVGDAVGGSNLSVAELAAVRRSVGNAS